MMIFLESLEEIMVRLEADPAASGALVGGLLAFIAAFLLLAIILALAFYIYMSLAFMALAKKTKYSSPGIAWIPVVGKALIASNAAKMPWWPILLLIGVVLPFIGSFFFLAFVVFLTIWMWKTFEAVGRPGWWAIFMVIPLVNIVWIILVGVAAWSEPEKKITRIKKSRR